MGNEKKTYENMEKGAMVPPKKKIFQFSVAMSADCKMKPYNNWNEIKSNWISLEEGKNRRNCIYF